MRDAYAMRLHSVPSRFSHKVLPDTYTEGRVGALFYIKVGVFFFGTVKFTRNT